MKKISENELLMVDVNEKVPIKKAIPLSIQHLFAMFGSSVLVPILFNIDPTTVLFFNGIGTLLYYKEKYTSIFGIKFCFSNSNIFII